MAQTGQIKQETVAGTTITLHRLKNKFKEIRSTPYMYQVRRNGADVGDPVFTKEAAEREFDATVRGERPRREDRGRNGGGRGGGGGLGGGLFGAGQF